MNIHKADFGNRLIKQLIECDRPFIATKIGAVEKHLIISKITGRSYDDLRNPASLNAGIRPSDDFTLNFFTEKAITAIKNVDILGHWSDADSYFYQQVNNNLELSELRFLEPFYFENPWSKSLANKKVLVIHPFEDSIKSQYLKRKEIFSNNDILPDFELLTLKSAQTNGGGLPDSKSFIESYKEMLEKLKKMDYDIALIGCGAYGILLADEVKKMNKKAIHIGGGLQILFGIKGKRWDVHPEISSMYNESWVRPLDSEKTINIDAVEGGTYW